MAAATGPAAATFGQTYGPALIGAAGQIASSFFGSGGANQHKALERKLGRQQLYDAQRPIRRLTEDAKKAGIHPLYALGASGSPSTQFVSGQPNSGSAVGDAIAKSTGYIANAMERANIRVLNTQATKNEAEASKATSEAARIAQNANMTNQPMLISGSRLPYGQSSPAEAFEPRYGEGADILGILNLVNDYRMLQRRESQRDSRRLGHTVKGKEKYSRGYTNKTPRMKSRGWSPAMKRWRDRQHFWPR